MPSKDQDGSRVISLRLADTLLDRLDRYLDWMETRRGETSSRNRIMRQALSQWLDSQEEQAGMTHPDVLTDHFHNAYTSLRSGQERVEIHRLRRLLNWPTDRFDALLEKLRAESQVALHVDDPSGLSEQEKRYSYEVNGQLYLSLSWQA
jgi:hypothetical protein